MADRTPRLSKAALFRHVNYEPHPLQRVVHASKARRRVIAAGARFGKTVVAQYEALAAVLAPCERSRGWIVGPTLDTPDRILQHVKAVLEQYFPHRMRSYEPRTRTLVVTNLAGGRSELRAKSTDAAAGLLGESLDYVICDEAASVRRHDWEVCVQRLVDRRGWSIVMSVPKGPGWFFEAYRRGLRSRDPESESWTAPSWSNPSIPKDVIEVERARLTPEAFDEQYGGKFIGVEREPCMTCGGPDPNLPSTHIVYHNDPLPSCVECGEPVDECGRTLVTLFPNGQTCVHLIRILDRPVRARLPVWDAPDIPE